MLYLVLLTVYSACMPWSVAVHRNCCYVLDNLVRWGYLQKGARDKLDAIFRHHHKVSILGWTLPAQTGVLCPHYLHRQASSVLITCTDRRPLSSLPAQTGVLCPHYLHRPASSVLITCTDRRPLSSLPAQTGVLCPHWLSLTLAFPTRKGVN